MAVKRLSLLVFLLSLSGCATPEAHAREKGGFEGWRDSFAQTALAQGVAPATLQKTLPLLTYDPEVIRLDRKQPEDKVSFATYLSNTLPASRINKARQLLDDHRLLLKEMADRYGVPAPMIVALWGVESSFGQNMGDFSVLDSLATLAYEGRRAAFFEKELIEALHLLEEEGMEPFDLQGSWAGAMGQCQFMPSTYRRYAVDGDGDGRRDIWANEADIFASIARYLAAEGWRSDLTWGQEVRLTQPLSPHLAGMETPRTTLFWHQKGIVPVQGNPPLPASDLPAYLIQPDGPEGRSFLVYDNFLALRRWNRSTYFATAVGLFADSLEE